MAPYKGDIPGVILNTLSEGHTVPVVVLLSGYQDSTLDEESTLGLKVHVCIDTGRILVLVLPAYEY